MPRKMLVTACSGSATNSVAVVVGPVGPTGRGHWSRSSTSSSVTSCQVGGAALGVGRRGVVGDGPGAGAVVAQVLAPQQELDGVPAGGDVGLAALLVAATIAVGGDLGEAGGVVDDAGVRVALDVVDVGLVHRPGVDLALGPVVGVVDRAVVEAEGLGRAVVVAGGQPLLLGGLEGGVGRVGDEGVDGLLHVVALVTEAS